MLKIYAANALFFILSIFSVCAQNFSWNTVPIKGGGFVSGLIYNPAEAGLLYARTDVGGAYRWDTTNKSWIPLTDAMTSGDDMSIWSLAPDPTNARKVYIATGLYSASWGNNGKVYGSNDKGTTWTKLADLPFKLGGNDPGRGICERLVVDPNKANILFLGSKKDGLYQSTDSGVTWTKVSSLSASYINFVEFDESTGNSGTATPTIYVGVADYIYNGGNLGIYRSTDAGATWSKMPNHPTSLTPKSFAPGNTALTPVPTKLTISSGNNIYITFCNSVTPNGDYQLAASYNSVSNGAVYKFDKSTTTWTDITPTNSANMQGGFSTIDVSANDANKIVISTTGRWWPMDELYFSSDAGANWASTFNSFNYAATWGSSLNKGAISTTKAPYAASLSPHWTTSVVINPTNDNEVMMGSGFGVFACYDVSGLFTNANSSNTASTTWIFEDDGLEETVPLAIVSPPSGASLVSAIGDFDGFVHTDLTQSPAAGRYKTSGNYMGTTNSLAFAENTPSNMVKTHGNDSYIKGSYSTDGGASWTLFTTQPSGVTTNTTGGKISISADGSKIVWAPESGPIAYSTNTGSSWTNCNGGISNGLNPVADRVNSLKFYVFDPQSQNLYSSADGGMNFSSVSLGTSAIASYAPQPDLCAVFGQEGHLWLANSTNGLYRSTNSGTSLTQINTVTEAYKVSVGKAATSGGYPAIFIWGIVSGVEGIFQSDDEGTTWERVDDAAHQYGRTHSCLAGDPRVYGRLYIGLGGRGIVYAEKSTITGMAGTRTTGLYDAVTAYPNPFSGQVYLKCPGAFTYSIYSVDGVLQETSSASNFATAGNNLPKGVHVVKIKQGDNTSVLRVIKE